MKNKVSNLRYNAFKIIFGLLVLLLFATPINAIDVTACGTLSTPNGNYILINSVSSTGTCFTIGDNGISLTSNSPYNEINYSTTSAGNGIVNPGYTGMNISNLNITTIAGGSNHAIYAFSGSGGNITNSKIKTISGNGINLNAFSNVNIINNTLNPTNTYGIYLISSSSNLINNNTALIAGGGIPIYFSSSSNNNVLNNNTLTSYSNAGIYFSASNNNLISGGSIFSYTGTSYYLASSYNNIFTNTNLTTRKIEHAVTLSWFNYSNGTDLPYVSTNVSTTSIITRTPYNWTQSNITFLDNTSVTAISYYNITGLLSNTNYNIYNNSVLQQKILTDINGKLPLFLVAHNTTPRKISILFEYPIVKGFVFDKSGVAVASAIVNDTIGNQNTTNSVGYYSFSSDSETPDAERIRATKSGYARNDTIFDISEDSDFHNLTIRPKTKMSTPGFEVFGVIIVISLLYYKKKWR